MNTHISRPVMTRSKCMVVVIPLLLTALIPVASANSKQRSSRFSNDARLEESGQWEAWQADCAHLLCCRNVGASAQQHNSPRRANTDCDND
jgi:hypothetical protein